MKKEILLRSSWQDVNIGDIAHTPSLLAILEKYVPEAKVTVWASPGMTDEVIAMEHKRFPTVQFVKGNTDRTDVRDAVMRADFFLHGSGPFLVGVHEVKQYLELKGGKFGVFGITYRENEYEKDMMNQAEFVYFRDSVSLARAEHAGVNAKQLAFGPDAAFAIDLENEEKANTFLSASGLKPKQYVCCIPRLRITPYWKIRQGEPYNQEADALNNRYKEQDHRYLRAAIIKILESTEFKVLICPEDQTQMAVGKEMLLDKLPEKYLDRVVIRQDYWLTDEAVSVYRKSLGLFGNEMHSPIMCVGNHIPAIVCRWAQQSSKGLMWNDIGLGKWLFDSDAGIDDDHFANTALDMIVNHEAAVRKTEKAMEKVNELYGMMANKIRDAMDL